MKISWIMNPPGNMSRLEQSILNYCNNCYRFVCQTFAVWPVGKTNQNCVECWQSQSKFSVFFFFFWSTNKALRARCHGSQEFLASAGRVWGVSGSKFHRFPLISSGQLVPLKITMNTEETTILKSFPFQLEQQWRKPPKDLIMKIKVSSVATTNFSASSTRLRDILHPNSFHPHEINCTLIKSSVIVTLYPALLSFLYFWKLKARLNKFLLQI